MIIIERQIYVQSVSSRGPIESDEDRTSRHSQYGHFFFIQLNQVLGYDCKYRISQRFLIDLYVVVLSLSTIFDYLYY